MSFGKLKSLLTGDGSRMVAAELAEMLITC